MMREAVGHCPVCGREYVAVWMIESSEGLDGENYSDGIGYVHTPATVITKRESEMETRAAYDGDACYAFVDGREQTDEYPPQPIAKQA